MNYDNHIKIRLQNDVTLLSIVLIWIIFTTQIISGLKNIEEIKMPKQEQNKMKWNFIFKQLYYTCQI